MYLSSYTTKLLWSGDGQPGPLMIKLAKAMSRGAVSPESDLNILYPKNKAHPFQGSGFTPQWPHEGRGTGGQGQPQRGAFTNSKDAPRECWAWYASSVDQTWAGVASENFTFEIWFVLHPCGSYEQLVCLCPGAQAQCSVGRLSNSKPCSDGDPKHFYNH